MIALEALLGRENEAISYRIPLKLSTLAGASPLERARIFDVLRKAYSLRSALAHGLHGLEESVRVEGKDVPRKDFLLEVQGYLIRCIRLFIKARDLLIDKDSLLAMVEGAIVTQDRTDLEKQLCRWPGGRQS